METMADYADGLDALVAEHVSVLDCTTERERYEAHVFASSTSLTNGDLIGLLAVATERLAQAQK